MQNTGMVGIGNDCCHNSGPGSVTGFDGLSTGSVSTAAAVVGTVSAADIAAFGPTEALAEIACFAAVPETALAAFDSEPASAWCILL